MPMYNTDTRDLEEISKYAGMREDLVQAGGGNSSVKTTDGRMLIKASGVQMASITQSTGYSVVNYELIQRYMDQMLEHPERYSANEILERALLEGRRPSIETFLHAVTGRVTLHTHPTAVNVLLTRTNGMQVLESLFPEALMVGYAKPGLDLARLYYQAYLSKGITSELQLVFLKNHGLVVSGDTPEQVLVGTERVCKIVEEYIGMDNSGYRRAYEIYKAFRSADFGNGKIVVKVENKVVLDTYEHMKNSMWVYQICPDCVVFCGKETFHYAGSASFAEQLDNFLRTYGEPVLIESGNSLYILADSVKKAREIESVLMFSAQIASCNQNHSVDVLSVEEQDFLLNWDAEKYRRSAQ